MNKVKIFAVEFDTDCNFFVFAKNSKDALKYVRTMDIGMPILDPEEIKKFRELSYDDALEVIIDEVYPSNNLNGKSILLAHLFDESDSLINSTKKPFYGIVGDDFIAYK